MSRGNSAKKELNYEKRFVGIDSNRFYLYQFVDKKTKEVIELPEELEGDHVESKDKNNVLTIGTMVAGPVEDLVYYKPKQNRTPDWTPQRLKHLPEGKMYVLIPDGLEAISRASGIRWGDKSYTIKEFIRKAQEEGSLKIKMEGKGGEEWVFTIGSITAK